MNNVTVDIELQNDRASCLPGQTLNGTVRWQCSQKPEEASLHLIWYTEGRGTEDVGLVEERRFENPQPANEGAFEFQLPAGPYSFSGSLISLIWALELKVDDEVLRKEITLSPSGEEIKLGRVNKR